MLKNIIIFTIQPIKLVNYEKSNAFSGGVIALAACSDEMYNDVEKTEESMYSTNSFNENNPGYYHPGAPYKISLYMGAGTGLWMTSGHVIGISL